MAKIKLNWNYPTPGNITSVAAPPSTEAIPYAPNEENSICSSGETQPLDIKDVLDLITTDKDEHIGIHGYIKIDSSREFQYIKDLPTFYGDRVNGRRNDDAPRSIAISLGILNGIDGKELNNIKLVSVIIESSEDCECDHDDDLHLNTSDLGSHGGSIIKDLDLNGESYEVEYDPVGVLKIPLKILADINAGDEIKITYNAPISAVYQLTENGEYLDNAIEIYNIRKAEANIIGGKRYHDTLEMHLTMIGEN